MERIRTQRFAESITRGLEMMPERVLELIGPVHWHEGNLYFAGYSDEPAPPEAWACVSSPEHFRWGGRNADRCCTTVEGLTATLPPVPVIHELGHCLQFALGSYGGLWSWPIRNMVGLPSIAPLTEYEEEIYSEQFSEAMALWLAPREAIGIHARYDAGAERLWNDNPELLAFLNKLAGWPADRLPRALL